MYSHWLIYGVYITTTAIYIPQTAIPCSLRSKRHLPPPLIAITIIASFILASGRLPIFFVCSLSLSQLVRLYNSFYVSSDILRPFPPSFFCLPDKQRKQPIFNSGYYINFDTPLFYTSFHSLGLSSFPEASKRKLGRRGTCFRLCQREKRQPLRLKLYLHEKLEESTRVIELDPLSIEYFFLGLGMSSRGRSRMTEEALTAA